MPFDAMPIKVAEDVLKLRLALQGVRTGWIQNKWGGKGDAHHCTVGWLMEACDWDHAEATQLILDYVYPALPRGVQNDKARMWSVSRFNDRASTSHKRIIKLFDDAIALAEQAAVR